MNKTRLEAFSDGVLAIIITIMVLEIKIPHGSDWAELKPVIPTFLSYLLSFVYIAIYWGNHHHMLHSLKSVSSGIIWANMNLLFWLSLTPFSTGWMGENNFAPNTMLLYGMLLLANGVSFIILQKAIEKHAQDIEALKTAFVNMNKKGLISTIGYACAIPLAYVSPIISGALFIAMAIIWLIPDKNIEIALTEKPE
ncbi:MAG: TMEM175 family protein [Flavipsychrobacter sp.]|nr:TMEM175 family protein [Flavipsychrobacter sp.]